MGRKLNNGELEAMRKACEQHLDRCDMIGYGCARNVRKLDEALAPFLATRDKLVTKYGDEDASGAVTINEESEHWGEFFAEYAGLLAAETEVEIYEIKASTCLDRLTGQQMLEIGWMLDWSEE